MPPTFDPKTPCPHCGKKTLRLDNISGLIRCTSCFLSNIKLDEKESAEKVIVEDGGELTDKQIEELKKTHFVTWYYSIDEEGKQRREVVLYPLLEKSTDVPDLAVDQAKMRFHKWRLQEVVAKDRRWARDDLRKRGMVMQLKERDPQTKKIVKTYMRADGETPVKDSLWQFQVDQILRNYKSEDD